MELVEIADVPLLKTGTYRLRSGPATFTDEDLDAVVAAQDDPALRPIRVGPGHDSSHDGTPNFGFLKALRRVGDTVVGTLQVPAKLKDIIATAWPNRSVEGRRDVTTSTGKRHRLVVDRLALLGFTSPGIDLEDLHALMAAMTTDDYQGTEVVIAASAREETFQMTPKELREKLGLPEEATDEQVAAKLTELTKASTKDPEVERETERREVTKERTEREKETGTPEPAGAPTSDPAGPPDPAAAPEKAETRTAEPVAATRDPDLVQVSREQWEAVQAEIKASRKDREERERARRDRLVAAAAEDGRIAQDATPKWRERLDQSPEVTEDILASLEPTIPLGRELGHAGGGAGAGHADPFAGSGSTSGVFGTDQYPGGATRPGSIQASASDLSLPGDHLFSERDRARIEKARAAMRGAVA